MQQSEQINELAAALAKAQAEMAGAAKDSKGNFGKYADLASVWEAIRGPLTKNGLSVAQFPGLDEQGVLLTTVVMHTSGQWMRSELSMPVDRKNAHGVGSAITYARRYALSAAVGVAPEEDDGNAAANAPPPVVNKRQPQARKAQANAGEESQVSKPATPDQVERFRYLLNTLSDAEIQQLKIDVALKNVEDIAELPADRVVKGIKLIEEFKAAKRAA